MYVRRRGRRSASLHDIRTAYSLLSDYELRENTPRPRLTDRSHSVDAGTRTHSRHARSRPTRDYAYKRWVRCRLAEQLNDWLISSQCVLSAAAAALTDCSSVSPSQRLPSARVTRVKATVCPERSRPMYTFFITLLWQNTMSDFSWILHQ